MFELVMARAVAIACGYKDGNDLNRLRDDPLMKIAIDRCPESGAPLPSQSTISRLENAPTKTEAARLTAALIDQFSASVTPGKRCSMQLRRSSCTFRLALDAPKGRHAATTTSLLPLAR